MNELSLLVSLCGFFEGNSLQEVYVYNLTLHSILLVYSMVIVYYRYTSIVQYVHTICTMQYYVRRAR